MSDYVNASQPVGRTDRYYYYADGSYDIYSGGSRSWRNHNPGNVGVGPLAPGSIGNDNAAGTSLSIFPDTATGLAAQQTVLSASKYTSLSISDALKLYTNESNVSALTNYINAFVSAANNDPTHPVTSATILGSLTSTQLSAAIFAQDKAEGYAVGTITHVAQGKASDYDVVHNADGSWTVSNIRGTSPDVQHIFNSPGNENHIENIKYMDGAVFKLAANDILNQTDFAFVIDTTGSMDPYIAGVQSDATDLVNEIFGSGNVDAHISVLSFKDPQAGYPDQVILPFTTETTFADRQQAAISAIDSLGADGGGDIPEGDYSGLLLALNGSSGQWRDSAAVRNIVLFTDAPVKDTDLQATVDQYAADLGDSVSSASVASVAGVQEHTFAFSALSPGTSAFSAKIYTVQVGDDSTATASVQEIATDTGGQFFQAPTADDLVTALTKIVAAIQIGGTESDQAADDNALITPFVGSGVIDPTADETETLTVAPSSTSNGKFANLGDGVVDPTTDIYSITGTVEQVNSALQNLQFSPTPNEVAPGQTVTTLFTITDANGEGTTATDSSTSVIVTAVGNGVTLVGTYGADALSGHGDNDTLIGLSGSDILYGYAGADTLLGGPGVDQLYGGIGDDFLNGGLGSDTLLGGTGDDTLKGNSGNDVLLGGTGNDNLVGGDGSDLLLGGSGNDRLVGGSGADLLNGGAGDDGLIGGAGSDVFVFADNFGHDRVLDFSANQGDLIKFRGVAGITSFATLELKMTQVGADTFIAVDSDDSVLIRNTQASSLTAASFRFG